MRYRIVAVAALLALAACSSSSDTPDTKPTFGGGAARTVAPDDLAAAKEAAGIEDCPASDAAAPAEDALPDLVLDCLGGGDPVRLSGLAGTPTVINLWASWCAPCREELPLLARAHEAYGDDVRFIGIDVADDDPDQAIDLARRSGVTYPLLVDRDEQTRAPLRFNALPQTVLVDAQGRMVATERRAFRSYADLTASIDQHLGVSP